MALTPQQFEKLKAQLAVRKGEPITQETPSSGSFMSGIKDSAVKRGTGIIDAFKRAAGGQDPLQTAVQTVGQGAGFANDVIGEGVKSAVSALPDAITTPIKKIGVEILQTPVGQEGIKAIQSGVNAYQLWKAKNPAAASDLEGVVNIAALLPIGKLGEVGAKASSAGVDIATDTAKNLGKSIAKQTERVGAKVTDVVSPVESGVETVLRGGEKLTDQISLQDKFYKYKQQAEKAVKDYSQPTPLELAGQEGESALKKLQNQMKQIGTQKKELTKTLADKPVGDIIDTAKISIRNDLRERAGITFTKDGVLKNAKGRIATISDPSDLKLLQDVDKILTKVSQKPTFQRVDDTVDYIQDLLFKRESNTAVPVNKNIEGILKRAVNNLNTGLKEIGGEQYKTLNIKYSNRKQVFDKLNKALGIEGNKGASLMKQLFSPSGTAPRKLFGSIKDLTGIDLVQEATLAKFFMENIGDVRQASLLEQVLRGQGVKSSLIKKAVEKLQDPIGKAGRIIEKRKFELN